MRVSDMAQRAEASMGLLWLAMLALTKVWETAKNDCSASSLDQQQTGKEGEEGTGSNSPHSSPALKRRGCWYMAGASEGGQEGLIFKLKWGSLNY